MIWRLLKVARFAGPLVLTVASTMALAAPHKLAVAQSSGHIDENYRQQSGNRIVQREHQSRRKLRVSRRIKPASKPEPVRYYINFRARTASSYGHAFIWYGRTDKREIEVAGLHPASDSVVPYLLGHVIPVPAETGASYGDLDVTYMTASYTIFMNERQAGKAISYIKKLQKSGTLWHARHNNCVTFIASIADHVGLKIPDALDARPEEWVNGLKLLNGPEPELRFRTD